MARAPQWRVVKGRGRLFSGDQRVLKVPCKGCGEPFNLAWEQVVGREKGEQPRIRCPHCEEDHDERSRRRMLRRQKWISQRPDATDETCASFTLSRLDSARSTLTEVCRAWRRARLRAERGDDRSLGAFENLYLGRPRQTLGAVNVDAIYENGRDAVFHFEGAEQAVAALDVQDAGLYWTVAVFSPACVWIADYGHTIGDPREQDVWTSTAAAIEQAPVPMPVSIVGCDSGFLPQVVTAQCRRRRWWIPTVGSRSGANETALARPVGRSGVAVVGTAAAKSWITGRAMSGHVRFPQRITRRELREMIASETLQNRAGLVRWTPTPGVANHFLDCLVGCVWARSYRCIRATPRRMRLVAVG